MQPSLSITQLDSEEFQCCCHVCPHSGSILFAVQYCCGWSCGTQTRALAVLCVLSSQMCTEHWGVTDHYPLGRWSLCALESRESGGVCAREGVRGRVWVRVKLEKKGQVVILLLTFSTTTSFSHAVTNLALHYYLTESGLMRDLPDQMDSHEHII